MTKYYFNSMVALCKETTGHQEIASLLFNAMDNEKECLSYVQLSTAMFDAAKSGNIMILEFLLKDHPDLLFEVDCKEQRSLLHIAMLYRQESVYRLILNKGDSKKVMIQLIDFEGNNILHLAGMPARPEERFGLSTDHVLMHSEERWFQVYMSTRLAFFYKNNVFSLLFFYFTRPCAFLIFMVKKVDIGT